MKRISRTFEFLTVIFSAILVFSCTDNTKTLGVDMMPASDTLKVFYNSYSVPTESYKVTDPILARTSKSYLGQFTDPETKTTISADFIAQYHVTESEGNLFPPSIKDDYVTSIDVRLYIDQFIGDSLSTFKVSVYDLTNDLDPDADYYTNIDPTQYYDPTAAPLASKWYTLSDRIIEASERNSSGYVRSIRIPLPRTVGQQLYDAYKADKSQFSSTYKWLHSGLPCSKGLYFKLEYGEGAVAYIYITQIRINYTYYDEQLQRETTGVTLMSSTEEVIEVTNFDTSDLSTLAGDPTCTYVKSPAGIFTLVTLPIDNLSATDTINSASISFTRYNDATHEAFKLGIPKTLLMVRYDDFKNGFFEKYSIANDKTSYITSFTSSSNSYTFTNIARLIATCLHEKKQGTASANYNKVLLIPVEATYDTSKKLVKLNHDFGFNQARLVKNSGLSVIYSRFGD